MTVLISGNRLLADRSHPRSNGYARQRSWLMITLQVCIAAVVWCGWTSASQAAWPERPIRLIVPVAAGGGVDLMARILADRLSQQLPQRVLIENLGGGGGGSIAARAVANAEPDGYTLLFATPGIAALPATHQPPPFDPIADFSPVSLVTEFPLVAIIRPEFPRRHFRTSSRCSKQIRKNTITVQAA